MAIGIAALLDDIAALAKAAAASIDDVALAAGRTSVKAAGVVVDDTAVAPTFVEGVDPKREFPIIAKIARGSIVNKLLIILPIAMLLSQFAPWALTPLLMIGGSYLCFEGAEKIWEMISGQHREEASDESRRGPDAEKRIVGSAVRTDFILSAEILIISLNEVRDEPFWQRLAVLIVVSVVITIGVYGVVALIVKMDDLGLALAKREARGTQALGRGLVRAMPGVLAVISVVGMLAMLWVGGHIMLQGVDALGWHAPEGLVHHLQEGVALWPASAAIAWGVETLCSLVIGLAWGLVIFGLVHLVQRVIARRRADRAGATAVSRPGRG